MSPTPEPPPVARRALVMGLGRFGGGLGAARWLARRGARVLVTDQAPPEELADSVAALAGLDVELVLGGHREEDFRRAELVVANPAVRPDHPLLQAARAAGARVTSEIELFLEASPARALCVTGTQGKSSTCHLLAALLERSGFRVHLGGNIGGSLLERLETIGPDDRVVLELSSYQLEAFAEPAPGSTRRVDAVAITNVLADHLERHASVEAYCAAKLRILSLPRAGGQACLPGEDGRMWGADAPGLRRIAHWPADAAPATNGVRHDDERFTLDGEELGRVRDLALPGRFQRRNAALALALARLSGADPRDLARALPTIPGLPHRLEDLGLVRGRRVWDNGVSTTPDSTVAALADVARGCTLLAGGKRKALDYGGLVRAAAAHEARVVTFGAAAEELALAFGSGGVACESEPRFEHAVARALELTPLGGELLFSPACASFDAFPNFLARARAFRALLERSREPVAG